MENDTMFPESMVQGGMTCKYRMQLQGRGTNGEGSMGVRLQWGMTRTA